MTHNPGMCLDRELNWWAFSFQAGAQSTEPHLPGREDIFYLIYFLIKKYFTDYVITIVPILLPWPLSTWYPLHSSNAPLSSCPWVMHISSLTSPFPILFLTSPCLYYPYQLCILIPALFLPLPPHSWWLSKWSLYLSFCFCSNCLLWLFV